MKSASLGNHYGGKDLSAFKIPAGREGGYSTGNQGEKEGKARPHDHRQEGVWVLF